MKPAATFPFLLLALAALACRESGEGTSLVDRTDPLRAGIATDTVSESASRFTQEFYDLLAQRDWSVHPVDAAVADQPQFFSPELLSALQADVNVRMEHPGEIVGLDWDPFTASQDPCLPYKVHRTTNNGDTVLVAIKGACADTAAGSPPDVVAVLGRSESRWVFLDFRYPDAETNLLDALARLQHQPERDSTVY